MKRFIPFILFCTICILISAFTTSTTTLKQIDKKYGINKEKFLERHNYYREQVGVPPLEWSDELADYAKEWADKLKKNCKMQHRSEDTYGENIYWNMSPSTEYNVVDYWASEEEYFNHKKPICERKKIGVYGHYTQIIWRETTHVGAAVVTCSNGSQIWVSNYDPAGNWVGEKVY